MMNIELKHRINWFLLVFLSIYELFIIGCTYAWISAGVMVGTHKALIFVPIFLIMFAIWFLDFILWQVRGYEVISMDDDDLIIKKRGKLFNSKMMININDIENIEVSKFKLRYLLFNNLYFSAFGVGKICVRYLGRSYRFGYGITKDDAKEYIEEINANILQTKEKYIDYIN